ncbi:hypothetical protein NBRC10513_000233 [Rhodotorula toruloides]
MWVIELLCWLVATLTIRPQPAALPDELWIQVFLQLDSFTLRKIQRVCRKFRLIIVGKDFDNILCRALSRAPLHTGQRLRVNEILRCIHLVSKKDVESDLRYMGCLSTPPASPPNFGYAFSPTSKTIVFSHPREISHVFTADEESFAFAPPPGLSAHQVLLRLAHYIRLGDAQGRSTKLSPEDRYYLFPGPRIAICTNEGAMRGIWRLEGEGEVTVSETGEVWVRWRRVRLPMFNLLDFRRAG